MTLQNDQARALDEMHQTTDGLHQKIRGILTDFSQVRDQSAQNRSAKAAALVNEVTGWLLGCTLADVGIVSALGVAVIRSVNGQIGGDPASVAHAALDIAQGKLDTRIALSANDTKIVLYAVRSCRPICAPPWQRSVAAPNR